MADTYTANLNLVKPDIGGDVNTWGTLLNGNMDAIDAGVNTAQTTANAAVVNASNGTHALKLTANGNSVDVTIDSTDVGTIWHTGNFTPGNYLPVAGGTITNNLTVNGTLTNYGRWQASNMYINTGDNSLRNNVGTVFQGDGNVYGSAWNNGIGNGWLNSYVVAKRNNNPNSGFVYTDSNNAVKINWDGSRLHGYVDGTDQGQLWTTANLNPGAYANIGATCPWNSGIMEIGAIGPGGVGTIDAGSPWVLEGLRTVQTYGWIYMRVVYLRNN
ncbi:hypothetical protein [Paraburkholderia oxyphila]|uniref:hypothetical protein n=1 Tax=Paraburkholderia oxyphila TaxID=614212 RepID=UPI0004811788|nr:hypothetical protein [Paraburkholderia oxyphila]